MIRPIAAVFASLVLSVTVLANFSAAQEQQSREFDVKGLLAEIPDFVGKVNPPVQAQVDDEARRPLAANRLLDQLRVALGEGQKPALKIEGDKLLANGTAAELSALEQVLGALHESRNRQLNVEVRLILLTPALVGELPNELRTSIAAARLAPQVVAQQDVARLIGNGNAFISAPNLTLFNQQRAFVEVSTSRPYNRDVAKDEGGEWKVIGDAAWTGIHLSVRSAVDPDGEQASADIEATFQSVLGFDDIPVEGTELVRQVPILDRVEVNRVAVGANRNLLLYAGPVERARGDNVEQGQDLLLLLVRLQPIVQRPLE